MKNILIGIFLIVFCGLGINNTGVYAEDSSQKLENYEQKIGILNYKILKITDNLIQKGTEKTGIELYQKLIKKIQEVKDKRTIISNNTDIVLTDVKIFLGRQVDRLESSLQRKLNNGSTQLEYFGINSKFAGANQKEIKYIPKYVLMPVSKNSSYIYFDIRGRNNTMDTTYSPDYNLSGSLINTIGELEIIWDGDMKAKKIENFEAGNRTFNVNISTEKGNLQAGENHYILRGYANGNKIYQREFFLMYNDISEGEKTIFEELEYKGSLDKYDSGLNIFLSENFGYLKTLHENKIEYRLGLGDKPFGKKTLKLPSGDEFIYSQTYNKQLAIDYAQQGIVGEFKIKNGNNYSNVQVSSLENHEFNFPTIMYFDTGDFVIETGAGHEGVSKSYFYNKSENKIYDFYEDFIVKNEGEGAYQIYNIVSIDNKNIIIKEVKYCCVSVQNDNGYEYLSFDKNTKKLIKREAIEEGK